MVIIFFVLAFLVSGCFLKLLIPAPKRPFTTNELLVNKDELPIGWTIPWGLQKDTDNSRPSGSTQINLFKAPNAEKSDITQRISIYFSIEEAKNKFSELTKFPGNIDVEGWSFTSAEADEQKFSCYTYSNLNYPICTWLGRYQEIAIEVIGGLEPGRVTLEEMQVILKVIDKKISNYLKIATPSLTKN